MIKNGNQKSRSSLSKELLTYPSNSSTVIKDCTDKCHQAMNQTSHRGENLGLKPGVSMPSLDYGCAHRRRAALAREGEMFKIPVLCYWFIHISNKEIIQIHWHAMSIIIHFWESPPLCPTLNRAWIVLLLHSQLYLWGSPFWVRFLHMWSFFNPTIEEVTFRLNGWCMLDVFMLPAFTCLENECQDLFFNPREGMHVCTLKTPSLHSHPKDFRIWRQN